MAFVALAVAWIATAAAVSIGIYITNDLTALWAMLIPTFISVKSGRSSNDDEVSQ